MGRVILDLCGGTGAWSSPYKRAGYEVHNMTLPIDVRLLEYIDEPIYGILAAPPCTCFASSGARWKRTPEQMKEALSVVDACLRAVVIYKPKFWALENPVGKLVRYLGRPKIYFNPYDYGDPYTKKTCLWGDFNIPKRNHIEPIKPKTKGQPDWHHNCIGKPKDVDRTTWRSVTPAKFAKAFFEVNR